MEHAYDPPPPHHDWMDAVSDKKSAFDKGLAGLGLEIRDGRAEHIRKTSADMPACSCTKYLTHHECPIHGDNINGSGAPPSYDPLTCAPKPPEPACEHSTLPKDKCRCLYCEPLDHKPPEPKPEPLHRQTLEAKVARGEKLSPEQELDYLGTPKPEGREARKWTLTHSPPDGWLVGYAGHTFPSKRTYTLVEKSALEAAQEDVRFYRREWESACERAQYTREIEAERNQLQRELAEARELVGAAERQGLAAREKEHAADRRMLTAANERITRLEQTLESQTRTLDAQLTQNETLSESRDAALAEVERLKRRPNECANCYVLPPHERNDLTAKLEIATAGLEKISCGNFIGHEQEIARTAIAELRDAKGEG